MKKYLIPVKKILRMINECQDQEQLNNCKTVVNNYVATAQKAGLINVNDLRNKLQGELLQRQEEIYLVKVFNK